MQWLIAFLSEKGLSPSVERQVVDNILTKPFPIMGMLLFPLVGLICWLRTGAPWLLIWIVAACGLSVARYTLARDYRKAPDSRRPGAWLRHISVIGTVTGLMSASLSFVIASGCDLLTELVVVLAITVIVSTTPLRGVLRDGALRALHCSLVPLAIVLAMTGDPTQIALAALVALDLVTLRAGVVHIHGLTTAMMVADEEKARLVDQLREANTTLSELANRDGLTGLLNRRAFDAALEKEWSRAEREDRSIGLLLLDLDHFKKLNDSLGHAAGDDALRRAAMAIRAAVRRPWDVAARYGGEEFAVILPETDETGALTVAEAARAAVEALDFAHPASPFGHLTVSIGAVSVEVRRGMRPEILFETADRALYIAKEGGRNRAAIAPIVPPSVAAAA